MAEYIKEIEKLLRGEAGQWTIAVAIASGIFVLVWVIKRLVLRRLNKRAQRGSTSLADAVACGFEATHLGLVLVLALYAGSLNLDLLPKVIKALDYAATVALFLQVGLWLAAVLEFWVSRSRARALASNAAAATSLSALSFVAQLVLWSLILLVALDNLGVNVTALVAGLGIGGIAVALAAQNILGDLFASLSIVIDKPFVIGDFIVVDNYMGTVENVGLKTTRLRSIDGELLIFSNSDLLKTRVRNYQQMSERRVVLGFGVAYQTPPDAVEKLPSTLRGIIETQKQVRFERAHFHGFKDTALQFELVYWVLDADYNLYMDIQQAINLALLRALADASITFAYSTLVARPAEAQGEPPQEPDAS